MGYLFMYNLFIAVEAEVVALPCDIGPRHAKALCRPQALAFGAVALVPTRKDVRQIVLRVILGAEHSLRDGAKPGVTQQWCASVVERPAVCFHVIKPNMVRAAGVGLGEQQN